MTGSFKTTMVKYFAKPHAAVVETVVAVALASVTMVRGELVQLLSSGTYSDEQRVAVIWESGR